MKRLQRDFFNRPVLTVAQELLGKTLAYKEHQGIITETEAYHGHDDPACHASRGHTPRTDVMFGPPGFSYVYFIYGMYHCLNIVTEAEGTAAAVLIRGVQYPQDPKVVLNGPGKLCRYFGITLTDNRTDLVVSKNFYVLDTPSYPSYDITPRIGINQGQDKLWRFVVRL